MRYNKKGRNKSLKVNRIKNLLFFIALSFVCVKAGSYGGTILSKIDGRVVKNIDVNSFKAILNITFPLIDSVYNSGNISTSFYGEINEVLKKVFNFDLNSPESLLNANSAIINSYYRVEYPQILLNRDSKNKLDYLSEDYDDSKVDNGLIVDQSSIYTEVEDNQKDQKQSSNYDKNFGKIYVQNKTNEKINIDELLKKSLKLNATKKGPKVLIYHTHTTESFVIKSSDLGKKNIPTRSRNPEETVVRVGEELADILRKKYDIEVIHNGTVHDYPDYNGSYGRSLDTAEKILKSYPSINVVLDVHRDALGSQKKMRVVKKINGKNAAQVMFVIGSNKSGLYHPNWKENLSFAVKLQARLNQISPGLARPIDLSQNRYNQHLTNGTIIIEVGGDGNVISECLESTKYLAQAINDVIESE